VTGYIIQRVLLFIPTLILLSFLVFGIMRVLPGDAAMAMLGGELGTFTEEDLEAVRKMLGTDKPLLVQYGLWIRDIPTGDFGLSYSFHRPVVGLMAKKVPVSLELAILALVISYLIAVPIGVLSAVKQDTWVDYGARLFTVAGIALPTFWVGILVLWALIRLFNWLPPLEYAQIWNDPLTNLQQLIFPALALGYFNIAFGARVTRSSMLEVMREDYIRTARSKGLHEILVIGRHALKNAFLPVLTVAGFQLGRLMGGSVLIEVVFAVPGVGSLLIDSVVNRDYPVVQTIILMIGVTVLTLNFAIDLLYGWLNPRIRYA
jgi:peptide/nickel transport system permease protein